MNMVPDWSRAGIPLCVCLTKELGTLLREDDPVRHERLAAIGKNGTQFSPINKCLSLLVTLLPIAQMAKIQAFLCKINKKV